MQRRILVVLVLAGMVLGGGMAIGPPRMAHAANPAEEALLKWLGEQYGGQGVDHIVEIIEGPNVQCPEGWAFTALGFLGFPTEWACYIEGSPDPEPVWGRGTVVAGGSTLTARSGPGRSHAPIRYFPDGWRLVIFCQMESSDVVEGQWGPTALWNYVGRIGGVDAWVSDGFVDTGSNGYVADRCPRT